MRYKIRLASICDANDIASVYVSSWKESFSSLIDPKYLANLTSESRTDIWKGIIQKNFCYTLVAEDENSSIIGFISGGKFRAKKKCDSEIYAIYVLQSYQNQGIGTSLRSNLIKLLIKDGYKSMCVWIFKNVTNNRHFFTNKSTKIDEDEIKIGTEKLTQECFYWADMKQLIANEPEPSKLAFLKIEKLQTFFSN